MGEIVVGEVICCWGERLRGGDKGREVRSGEDVRVGAREVRRGC